MNNTMKLTPFREELTDVINNLPESGPVTLVRNNTPVAEVRAIGPEIERQRTQDTLNVFRYLEDLSTGFPDLLFKLGIDTMDLLTETVRRHREFVQDGVTFDRYPGHCLPESGPLDVDETLARLYFGDDFPKESGDPYAWFLACARLQSEAARRGMGVTLPCPNAYDEDEPTFVALATSCGHTPESLVEFGIKALGDGVKLERLADMLGSEPVPADVLALAEYSDYRLGQLKEGGMSHSEAVEVFRRGLSFGAERWVSAGLRTADEIADVHKDGVSVELALRAARDGLTPQEWRVAVPKIQHLKYRGVPRVFSDEGPGLLPFRMLVQAADEGVSLVRWDSSSLPVSQRQRTHSTAQDRKKLYPWIMVYDDRILELARRGISPSYISAFSDLMKATHNGDKWGNWTFVSLAVRAYELGLSTALATAMCRSGSAVTFTPDDLIAVLEAGVPDVGTARYLSESYSKAQEWVDFLRERRSSQPLVDSFVASAKESGDWAELAIAVERLVKLFTRNKYLARSYAYAKSAADLFVAGRRLNGHQLLSLINVTRTFVLDTSSYVGVKWREEALKDLKVGDRMAEGLRDELML